MKIIKNAFLTLLVPHAELKSSAVEVICGTCGLASVQHQSFQQSSHTFTTSNIIASHHRQQYPQNLCFDQQFYLFQRVLIFN